MEQGYEFASQFNEKWSVLVRRIMRMLSENARVPLSDMAKELGVSRRTARDKMLKAEKEFGTKYTLELNEELLGLTTPHMVLVKFSKKPDYEKVAGILAKSHIPQVVATINGNYDMFIYANAESTREYVYWDKTTQVLLAEYGVFWQPSDLAFRHIGFFPIRNALIERLNIPKKYKDILLILNENSRTTFSEISKRLGMHFNTVAYNFNKLMKMGYIKRFTIVIRNPPPLSLTSMFGKYVISEGWEDDAMKMRKEVTFIDDKQPLLSRCLFSAQLVGSYDFFFVGAYDNDDIGYRRLVKYYRMRFKRHKLRVTYGSVSKVLVGDFPTRNLDVRKEFNMIRWIPNSEPVITKPGASA